MNYMEQYDYINRILGKNRAGFGLISACGSFGEIDSNVDYEKTVKGNTTTYIANLGGIVLKSEFIKDNFVTVRQDSFLNKSKNEIILNNLLSRFLLQGGEYSVYTQYSAWQTESQGDWQKLVTCVKAESKGVRTCDGVAPIMALKNIANGSTTVFNLIPNCKWKMEASIIPCSDKMKMTLLETGFSNDGLNMVVKTNEEIFLPKIIFYDAENDISLDGYKFQEYLLKEQDKKTMPIMYNTWLYRFDNFDVDELFKQIDEASSLGIEVFTVDAGWFGKPYEWPQYVGDWEESDESASKGRLKEISNRVIEKGMKFGLWFEPERVGIKAKSKEQNSEYYFDDVFLDFSNDKAIKFVFDKISKVIEKYNVGFVKFDFNDTTPYSPLHDSFYNYYKGQQHFISLLRQKFPNLYIENCSSGGYRMSANYLNYDSFWLSDNQSPIFGVQILKETAKRLPLQYVERWAVLTFADGVPTYGKEMEKIPVYCNDALWQSLCRIDNSYLFAFFTGGPFGFSCDLTSFTQEFKYRLSEFISSYKKQREFYLNALQTVIYDSLNFTAIEYFDKNFENVEIIVFSQKVDSPIIQIFPLLQKDCLYMLNGNKVSGEKLLRDGIFIDGFLKDNMAKTIKLNKIK